MRTDIPLLEGAFQALAIEAQATDDEIGRRLSVGHGTLKNCDIAHAVTGVTTQKTILSGVETVKPGFAKIAQNHA